MRFVLNSWHPIMSIFSSDTRRWVGGPVVEYDFSGRPARSERCCGTGASAMPRQEFAVIWSLSSANFVLRQRRGANRCPEEPVVTDLVLAQDHPGCEPVAQPLALSSCNPVWSNGFRDICARPPAVDACHRIPDVVIEIPSGTNGLVRYRAERRCGCRWRTQSTMRYKPATLPPALGVSPAPKRD